MSYTTLDRLKSTLGKEVIRDDDLLDLLLEAAETVVDDHCGRRFDALADPLPSASSRSYVPYDDLVFCDDIADPTGIVIVDNGTTLATTDYQLEPINQLGSDRRYRPINMVRRLNGCWSTNGNAYEATVTITTARWGWTTFDSRVARATEMAAKDLWDLRETRFGRAGFGEYAAVVVRQNQALADLLRPLVSHTPGWLPGIA